MNRYIILCVLVLCIKVQEGVSWNSGSKVDQVLRHGILPMNFQLQKPQKFPPNTKVSEVFSKFAEGGAADAILSMLAPEPFASKIRWESDNPTTTSKYNNSNGAYEYYLDGHCSWEINGAGSSFGGQTFGGIATPWLGGQDNRLKFNDFQFFGHWLTEAKFNNSYQAARDDIAKNYGNENNNCFNSGYGGRRRYSHPTVIRAEIADCLQLSPVFIESYNSLPAPLDLSNATQTQLYVEFCQRFGWYWTDTVSFTENLDVLYFDLFNGSSVWYVLSAFGSLQGDMVNKEKENLAPGNVYIKGWDSPALFTGVDEDAPNYIYLSFFGWGQTQLNQTIRRNWQTFYSMYTFGPSPNRKLDDSIMRRTYEDFCPKTKSPSATTEPIIVPIAVNQTIGPTRAPTFTATNFTTSAPTSSGACARCIPAVSKSLQALMLMLMLMLLMLML